MTLHSRLATVAAFVTIAAALMAAQAKPDFTGTWVPNPEKTAAARAAAAPASAPGAGAGGLRGGGGGSMAPMGAAPMPYVLTQTTRDLTITRDPGDGTVQKWVYKLDGSESVNTNSRTTLTTRSTFTAAKLVTEGTQTTKTDQAEITGAFKEVRWIDKDGAMRVETTRVMNSGASTTGYQVLDKKK